MYWKLFVFLQLVALCCGSILPDGFDEKIVGGVVAQDGVAPYQVSLRTNSNGHFCGASILSRYTILTAAHCLVNLTVSSYIAVVGTNQLNQGGYAYKVYSQTIHEAYDPNYVLNDIAVLVVTVPIEFSPKIQPIELFSSFVDGGAVVTLTGWGLTTYPGSGPPNDLQIINLNSITVSQCKSALPNTILESQLCTFNKVGQGACYGDSGGPLVLGGKQVGVVSWGYPCGVGYPDVFTRVNSFEKWVIANKVV